MANGVASSDAPDLVARTRTEQRRLELVGDPTPLATAVQIVLSDWLATLPHAIREPNDRHTYEQTLLHGYESLLASLDGERRARRGVYYTPAPVVDYVVRGVQEIIEHHPALSQSPVVIDPACGTGCFLVEANRRLHSDARLVGFDIDPAPVLIAQHLLRDSGNVSLHVDNVLEQCAADLNMVIPAGTTSLVVLGNPPWSGISANMSQPVRQLVDAYKAINGIPLGERKLWLQDDYVKFIRVSQMMVESVGRGVVALVSNQAFLDNPTFRGMRASLMQTFDQIDVLDLGGHAMRRARGSSTDDNVFEIRQGVAVVFMRKWTEGNGETEGRIRTHSIRGRRPAKFAWLNENGWASTPFVSVPATPPLRLFVNLPDIHVSRKETPELWSLPNVFSLHSAGIITARDRVVVDACRDRLRARLATFADLAVTDDEIRHQFFPRRRSRTYPPGDTRGWRLADARRVLAGMSTADLDVHIQPCDYRPFDRRWMLYHPAFVDWPRTNVNQHILGRDNIALVSVRQVAEGNFTHALVSRHLVESRLTISNKGTAFVFPLWQYEDGRRAANFSEEFLDHARARLGDALLPQDLFAYIFATLCSPSYREAHRVALTFDWPRIELPNDVDDAAWSHRVGVGHQLISIFDSIAGPGDCDDPATIDRSDSIRTFEVGGYPVVRKWKKSRGREMDAKTLHAVRELQRLSEASDQFSGIG